jgi:hypothetical protein
MELPVSTMAEVFESPDGRFAVWDYDIEGSVKLGDGARWIEDHWEWNEIQHVLDARCPKCASSEPCQQQIQLFPLRGHIVIVHDEADVLPVGEA